MKNAINDLIVSHKRQLFIISSGSNIEKYYRTSNLHLLFIIHHESNSRIISSFDNFVFIDIALIGVECFKASNYSSLSKLEENNFETKLLEDARTSQFQAINQSRTTLNLQTINLSFISLNSCTTKAFIRALTNFFITQLIACTT